MGVESIDLETTTTFSLDSDGERSANAADEPVSIVAVPVAPCRRPAVKDALADQSETAESTTDVLADAEETTEEVYGLAATEEVGKDALAAAAANQMVADGPVNITKVDVSNDYEDWLKSVEFTTPAVEYFDAEEEELTTESQDSEATEAAATDWPTTDWPTTGWPSTDSPPFVDSRQNAAVAPKKKRSYQGYRVYRVILPTDESVARILALEGEPGIEFWADPHLLLRPRGLFVTSAADILTSPQAVPLIERVFRESRAPFSVLVADVQVIPNCNFAI